jgi:hypothetical protein
VRLQHSPPHYDVEKVLAVPKGELADRGGGEIDILVGRNNTHFFPQDLDSPQGTDSQGWACRALSVTKLSL